MNLLPLKRTTYWFIWRRMSILKFGFDWNIHYKMLSNSAGNFRDKLLFGVIVKQDIFFVSSIRFGWTVLYVQINRTCTGYYNNVVFRIVQYRSEINRKYLLFRTFGVG